MVRYYRSLLAAAVVSVLAVPAFAQTPAPAARAAATQAPAAPDTAPAGDSAAVAPAKPVSHAATSPKKAKTVKHTHKHVAAVKTKPAHTDEAATPPAQK